MRLPPTTRAAAPAANLNAPYIHRRARRHYLVPLQPAAGRRAWRRATRWTEVAAAAAAGGGAYGLQADVWSIGVVLYILLRWGQLAETSTQLERPRVAR